jgi:hypothetical protein
MRKRSLVVFAALGLAACRKQIPDPCEPETFNNLACEEAVRRGGYYSHGTFVPRIYPQLYPFYYSRYGTYVTGGGISRPSPAGSYAAPAPGVTRGGFGVTGSGAS